jgi:hypothetical protein
LGFLLLCCLRSDSAKQKKAAAIGRRRRRSKEDDRASHATVVDLGSGGSLWVLALIPIMDDYWASWIDGWMESFTKNDHDILYYM